MNIDCWKCGKPISDLPSRISFREMCPHCESYLHCCKNCVNYQVGRPNDCKIPGTEYISDREGLNFCEEFRILGKAQSPQKDPKDGFKRLFDD